MYNRNQDKQLNPSEILEPLHTCLKELLDLQSKGLSNNIVYTDDDVIAATLMYAHVLSNRYTHILSDEKAGIALAEELSAHFSSVITETTLAMTRVDASKYYQRKRE